MSSAATAEPGEMASPAAPKALSLHQGVAIAFRPLLARANADWMLALESLSQRQAGDIGADLGRIAAVWSDSLVDRLTALGLRTLVLELQVARIAGRLTGATADQRFRSFFDGLADRARLQALLDEYPALARLLSGAVADWLRFGIEVLSHFAADREALHATFGLDARCDPLVALRAADGADRHRRGRAVLVAEFASGRRLLYKPRESTLDVHFHELLRWIETRSGQFAFRVPATLAIDDHAWVEFIEHRPCASDDEVSTFYRRAGEYLALLYALDASDFHFGNMIAAGTFPVPIDLETLFHPALFETPTDAAAARASDAMCHSVLKVGLLPWRVGARTDGADIGGVSAPATQRTPRPVLMAESANTDEMHLVRRTAQFGSGRHLPRVPGDDGGGVVENRDVFEAGFESMYTFLLEQRDSLLGTDGPLARFSADRVRVIARATNGYALMLQESLHPDLLCDAAASDALLARLRAGIDTEEPTRRAALAAIIEAEEADLRAGDIPVFWAAADATSLFDSQDREIAGALPQCPLDRARARLREFGPADLARQRWIIRSSLVTLRAAGHVRTAPGRPQQTAPKRREDLPGDALAAARAIGHHLDETAFRSGGGATWLGLHAAGHASWTLGPLDNTLYDGLPGVILFLAYLAEVGSDPAPRRLAEEALAAWSHSLQATDFADGTIGAFGVWGGAIYLLSHLAPLWQRPDLAEQAQRLVGDLVPLIDADRDFDIISGAAGCLASLLSLHVATGSAAALRAARICGDHLIAHAAPQSAGWGWRAAGSGVALGGFSHGASGIGWALNRLAQASAEPGYAAAAREAIAYDRSLRIGANDAWRDLRRSEASAFETNWCHGAPGIGLARIDCLARHDDEITRAEIGGTLQATLRGGFGANHCLCHGDLGNLELLLQAERRLPADPLLRRRVDEVAARVLDEINVVGWRCGLPLQVDAPGLMVGLAGIGYGLLRVARPHTVPAVLLLDPAPRTISGAPVPSRRTLEGVS